MLLHHARCPRNVVAGAMTMYEGQWRNGTLTLVILGGCFLYFPTDAFNRLSPETLEQAMAGSHQRSAS